MADAVAKPGFWSRVFKRDKNLSPSILGSVSGSSYGGRWQTLFDWYPGAWQQDNLPEITEQRAFHAVFACMTLIASDIGKLRQKLVSLQDGIWIETSSRQYSPLLVKPNRYQNHIQFKEFWITSKLSHGNTYALKQRDGAGNIVALYILDPCSVTPLVSPAGDIFYQLGQDNLTGLDESIVVPAREIIHDRMNCLFHPLVGISPIYASGLAASQGLKMQQNATKFFGNQSRASGLLTAPGAISNETAERLRDKWQENYSGNNYGKVAVLGDGLKYEGMSVSPVDAQLVEQMKWSAEVVCSTFHVPPFKIGLGQMPTYQNGEMLNQIYYSDCLQSLMEQYEAAMDDGLELMRFGTLGVELDVDGLLRMDTATKVKTLTDSINGGLLTTNEARRSIDQPKVEGGDTIWRQQQYYSLEALAERDRNSPLVEEPAPPANDEMSDDEIAAALSDEEEAA